MTSAHYRQAKVLPAKMIHSTAREPATMRACCRPTLLPLNPEHTADLMRRMAHVANRAETAEEVVLAFQPEWAPPFGEACELIGG